MAAIVEQRRPTAIDCFAGAGGLSLGLVRAGFEIRAAFDWDADAVGTYRRNIAEHVNALDAETLSGSKLLMLAGLDKDSCSLVAGGPPCQGFSVQRRGSDEDGRNDLVLQFLRIVLEIQPTMFLMENVSAIGGPRGRAHFDEFCSKADSGGYRIHSQVLDAADYGVPQHRRRMLIVGEIADGREYFSFPAPTCEPTRYKTVHDAIGDLPSPESEEARLFANHTPDNISELNRIRISYVPQGGGREHIPPHLRLPCHAVSVEKTGHRNVYGRLAWNEPSGTITTKCNSFTRGKFAHPAENRNISMREAARLQGFPDDFIFCGDKVAVAHQIGNAVPPPLAEIIGTAIRYAIDARQRNEPAYCRPRQLYLDV
jgi:DNA (cytosine-5)-methyltransferase 1